MAESVRCPHCGATNTPSQAGAPFFCSKCKAIVVPGAPVKSGSGASHGGGYASGPPSPSSPTAVRPHEADRRVSDRQMESALEASRSAIPASYVSRFEGTAPRDATTRSRGVAVAGSLGIGMLLAGVAGLVGGAVLGWVGESVFRVPILFPFAIGWAMKHALAAGSGGGTPDRGVVGGFAYLLLVFASFGLMRWTEYYVIADRESRHYAEAYGTSAPRALAEPAVAIAHLRVLDGNATGEAVLADGTRLSIERERERLTDARATGRTPSDEYDIELLAATGQPGFAGYVELATSQGVALRPLSTWEGLPLPGFAVIALWLVELAVLILMAYSRLD